MSIRVFVRLSMRGILFLWGGLLPAGAQDRKVRVTMARDEDDEQGEDAGDGPVDIEKIKPNVQENKGEIR